MTLACGETGPPGPEVATASEAEYPRELCKAYIKCVWQQLRRAGVKAPKASADAAATGARDIRQFSMKRVPPLLGEFWLVPPASVALLLPDVCCKTVKATASIGKSGVSVGLPQSIEQAQQCVKECAEMPDTTFACSEGVGERVGFYRTPLQTAQACLKLKHPVEFASPVPDLLARCVVDVLNMGPVAIVH